MSAPAIAAERIKFFSLRPLTWMLWLGIIGMVCTAWLLGASAKASGDNGFDTYTPAPELVFSTLQLAQLFLATVAALCLTTEYSSGTTTSSLHAVPRRGVLYAAKAVFLFVTGTVMGIVWVGLGTVPAALSAGEYGVFDTVDLIRALAGTGVYLGLMMLMVLGIAALCRDSVGTIVAALVLLIGMPQLLGLVNVEWISTAVDYLPTAAATGLATGATEPYGSAMALRVLLLWAAGLLVVGWVSLKYRDA